MVCVKEHDVNTDDNKMKWRKRTIRQRYFSENFLYEGIFEKLVFNMYIT